MQRAWDNARVLKQAIEAAQVSMAPECFHVELRANCQFSWGIERLLTDSKCYPISFVFMPQKADDTLCYLHRKTQQISCL